MDPLIRTLVRYQEQNLEIARVEARLARIPLDVQAADAEQQAATTAAGAAKDRLHDAQKRKRDGERELQDLEQKISKYNDQSRDVKTNEQYRAIMQEIQNVKARIGEVEERILVAMEDADNAERLIREEEKAAAARRPEFDAKRAALAAEQARLSEERGRLIAGRDATTTEIPAEAMEAYNRIAAMRGAVVMARARDERCTGCNVRIRPQIFSDVRKNNQIIHCETCKRILFYVEEPPAPGAETPAPTPPAEGGEAAAPPEPA